MAPNRIMDGVAVRRALFLIAPLVLSALAMSACGSGGRGPTTTVPDRELDAEVLNEVLGRQLAAVDAYGTALPALRGFARTAARRFRAQEQEHVDATLKTLRGLGAEADPAMETVDPDGLATPSAALRFLYELESATIDAELNAITRLTGSVPRALLASMVANQAERLVLIRRALGAKPLEAVPEPFEDGTTPGPWEMMRP